MAWLSLDVVYYIGISILLAWIIKQVLSGGMLSHFPGPPAWPIVGNTLQFDYKKPRLTLLDWSRRYGGVYRVRSNMGDLICVSDLEVVHDILVRNGKAFSGRPTSFRWNYVARGNSLLTMPPNAKWKAIRKLSHRYIKQFGTGMSHLEDILVDASKYMLREFESKKGEHINSMEILKHTALSSITVLLLGKALTPEHPLHGMLLKYERGFTYYLAVGSVPLVLLDVLPVLFYLPLRDYKGLREFVKLQNNCWKAIKELQTETKEESLTKLLLENVTHDAADSEGITEDAAAMTCMTLIFAGVITTSVTMHVLLNTLAFQPEIQETIHTEISSGRTDGQVTLSDRPAMPYLRAAIFETLRYFSTTPEGGMAHVATTDTEIEGHGCVPKNSLVLNNTWALHHDEKLWGDPYVFRPERFLDEHGNLLPADHPTRKQLLPFGAGPRVCLGEAFAMARLFLWSAAVVQNFRITPAPGSSSCWMDADIHEDDGALMKPLPTEMIFTPRV